MASSPRTAMPSCPDLLLRESHNPPKKSHKPLVHNATSLAWDIEYYQAKIFDIIVIEIG